MLTLMTTVCAAEPMTWPHAVAIVGVAFAMAWIFVTIIRGPRG